MSAAQPLPVAVCSPHPVVRTGLKTLLGRYPDRFRIVSAADEHEREEPGVVLYDVFALRSGDDELARLLDRTQAKVLAVGRELRPDLMSRALAAGVDGFVPLGAAEDELVEAVESAASAGNGNGQPGRTTGPALERVNRPGGEFGLSARESDVLTLIVQGLTNKQIADRLYLSINSVKTYVRNAYSKVGAANRSQAVGWAIRHGFGHAGEDGA
jgi:DNA-binding NarL/FixJ family response regulator